MRPSRGSARLAGFSHPTAIRTPARAGSPRERQVPAIPGSLREAPLRVRLLWLGLAALFVLAVAFVLFAGDPFGRELAAIRAQAGRASPRQFARAYLWWMALVNGLALLGLLVGWRRWARPAEAQLFRAFAPRGRVSRTLLLGLLTAMAMLSLTALPRLDQSLWEDEKYMVRRSIAGAYEQKPSGEIVFDAVPWRDTFFYYRKPNNHVPYSIAARLAWEGWRTLTQPEDLRAPEWVVRVPAYLAGLAGLATVAALLVRLGFPWAALGAAWILALHPWYLRFASEVRGYALLLALIPALVHAALRVLERGSVPRWTLYGALQLLLLWTYPGAIFVPVVANLAVGTVLWRRRRATTPGGEAPLQRFLLTNVLSGLVWLQLNLPNMMQFLEYAKSWRSEVTERFLREVGGLLLLGTHHGVAEPGFLTLAVVAERHPVLFPALVALAAAALVAGAIRLGRAGAPGRLALAVLVLPAPLTLLLAILRGDHLYTWYLIHGLQGVTALLALGISGAAALRPRSQPRAPWAIGALALFLAGYAVLTGPMRELLRRTEVQPTFVMLEAMGWRPHVDLRREPPFLSAGIYGTPRYYDPRSRVTATPEDLIAMMREADARGMPLYVTYNRAALARKRRPEVFALVARRDLFEPVGSFDGLFPKYRREVLRYRPGSVARLGSTESAGRTGETSAPRPR